MKCTLCGFESSDENQFKKYSYTHLKKGNPKINCVETLCFNCSNKESQRENLFDEIFDYWKNCDIDKVIQLYKEKKMELSSGENFTLTEFDNAKIEQKNEGDWVTLKNFIDAYKSDIKNQQIVNDYYSQNKKDAQSNVQKRLALCGTYEFKTKYGYNRLVLEFNTEGTKQFELIAFEKNGSYIDGFKGIWELYSTPHVYVGLNVLHYYDINKQIAKEEEFADISISMEFKKKGIYSPESRILLCGGEDKYKKIDDCGTCNILWGR